MLPFLVSVPCTGSVDGALGFHKVTISFGPARSVGSFASGFIGLLDLMPRAGRSDNFLWEK